MRCVIFCLLDNMLHGTWPWNRQGGFWLQKNIRHAWSESVEVDCIATTADALHSLHRINLNFDDFTLTLNFENFAFCYARTKAWFIQLQLPNPVGGYKQSEMCLAPNLKSGVCLMNCCMVVTAPGWMRLCGHCPSFCQTFRTGCWWSDDKMNS